MQKLVYTKSEDESCKNAMVRMLNVICARARVHIFQTRYVCGGFYVNCTRIICSSNCNLYPSLQTRCTKANVWNDDYCTAANARVTAVLLDVCVSLCACFRCRKFPGIVEKGVLDTLFILDYVER